METLPKELLIDILNYLPFRDLLQVSLVCVNFNEIINDSSKLLRKFRLNLNSRTLSDKEWIGSRNYCRVLMRATSSMSLNIVKSISENLIELRIMYGKMHLRSLTRILIKSSKLKELSIVKLNFISKDVLKEPLPVLKLNKLHYNGDKVLFRILMESSVKSVSVYSISNTSDEIKYFKKFLKVQKNLESLELSSFNEDLKIFEDDELLSVDFRLKKLLINTLKQFDMENFKKFLQIHRKSLNEVKILHDGTFEAIKLNYEEIVTVLSQFENLKVLTLNQLNLSAIPIISIESLTLQSIKKLKFDEICLNFPNLKTLEIYDTKNLKVDLTLSKLTELLIDGSNIISFNIPHLKRLTLCDLELKPAIFQSKKFNELVIENCKNFHFFTDFMRHDDVSLDFLKIETCIISQAEMMCLNSDKVKSSILLNCTVRKEFDTKRLRMKVG